MSDNLRNMKIKDLRDLAIEKYVNIRDNEGKLMKKCQLIIDMIDRPDIFINPIPYGVRSERNSGIV